MSGIYVRHSLLSAILGIVAACGDPGPQTVTVMSADAHPLFAARDGDGAWAAVTASGTEYTFAVTGARYAFAFACVTTGTVSLNILAATVSDGTDVEIDCANGPTGEPPGMQTLVTIQGTIGGLVSTQEARVHVGFNTAMPTAAMPDWTLDVPIATRDVFARRLVAAPVSDRVIRRNDVAISDGLTLDFDFTTEGFPPEMHTVTVDGSGPAVPTVLALFYNRSGGTPFPMGVFTDLTYLAIPASEMRGEDIHSVVVGVSDTTVGTYRNVRRTFIAAQDFSATLPQLPAAPTVSASARTPYLRPEATLPAGSDADWITTVYTQNETIPTTFTRAWSMAATRDFIADAGSASIAIPDLSALAGYVARWGLVDGNELRWQQLQWWNSEGAPALLDGNVPAAELDGRWERSTQLTGMTTL